MSGLPSEGVFTIDRVEARFEPRPWRFAEENAAAIAAHWQKMAAGRPGFYDGRVLLQYDAALEGRVFRARYMEVAYSSFLAWRDWGCPDPNVRNGFAMAALSTRDGAWLLGQMGAHTANPGRVYFAAGTPDRADVTAEGAVDLSGSALRELEEETGLSPAEVVASEGFTVVIEGNRVAFMRHIGLDRDADAARSDILARIARQAEQELADIVIVRRLADCRGRDMPEFMLKFFRHVLG